MKSLITTIVFVQIVLFTSCLSTKTTYNSSDSNNYRTEVTGAGFKKKTNPIGITATVASAAAGGYIGYQSNLLTYYENGAPKTNQIGNAVIGAVTGMGISMLVNNLQKNGKEWNVKNSKEQDAWIKKQGDQNVLLHEGTSLGSFTMISKSEKARRYFSISNYQDFEDYRNTFSQQGLLNSKYRESISRFSRNDLYLVYDKPYGLDTENIRLTKEAIYQKCSSLNDFIEVAEHIKDFRERARADAWKRCKTISDYARFSSGFREQRDQAETAAFRLVTLDGIALIREFRRYFPESRYHIEILQRSRAYLSYELVKEVAQVYELKDQPLRYKDENYVLVPQYHFAVITVDAVFSDVDISAQNTSNSGGVTGKKSYLSLPIPMINSQKSLFIIYTSKEHEVLKFSINSRSGRNFRYDIHFVEISSAERINGIILSEGIKRSADLGADYFNLSDNQKTWIKVGFEVYDFLTLGAREYVKKQMIGQSAELIRKLLFKDDFFSELTTKYIEELALQIAKNI